ncbi:MAG: serpin family protein [Defluviitaleaceae bacterium]|nr:serpin family protein [Defluviitaleaceae bacterium]
MDNLNDYLDGITVDEALQEKIIAQTKQAKSAKTSSHTKRNLRTHYAAWGVGLAACLVVLAGVWWFGGFAVTSRRDDTAAHSGATAQSGAELHAAPQSDAEQVESARRDAIFIESDRQTLTSLALTAAPLMTTSRAGRDREAELAARGANDFAFRLGALFAAEIGHDNFVFSPYSVWMPLAALLNATDAAFQVELMEALGVVGIAVEDVNRASSRMMYDLTRVAYRRQELNWRNPIHIANAIFVRYESELQEPFAQTFLDYFRGEVFRTDFRSPRAVEEINNWGASHTQNHIPEVIEWLHPETVAALVNAIFFSDRWRREFDVQETERDVFHAPGNDTEAYFMHMEWIAGNPTQLFTDDRVQAINLPFSRGGGMKIILPHDGDAVGLFADMTAEYFERMMTDTVDAVGTLLLPRFNIVNSLDLEKVLASLGVPLFCPLTASITGLLYDEGLFVSDAVQAAMINVDEQGTTAAAVTLFGMRLSGMQATTEYIFEMICNHPFVFILHQHTADGGAQILFMGVVNEP